jgi:hypothetical protein
MSNETILFTEVALILGVIVGWLSAERFHDFMEKTRHHYEELFEKNPHPELYDEDGELDRGDYMVINFDPGYDPDQFDPEDLQEL